MKLQIASLVVVILGLAGVPIFATAQSSEVQGLPEGYGKSNKKLELLVTLLKDKRTGREALRLYLIGALEGIEWANTELASKKQPRLFCPPTIALNADNAADMIVQEYTSYTGAYQDPVLQKVGRAGLSFLLLNGLKNSFPCK